MKITPVLLVILDGFGYRDNGDDNAIYRARKPNWDRLWSSYPHTTIHASEESVGLPAAQMGNSEVGHLNIGAGRIVHQEYTRIERAIATGEFFSNGVLREAVDTAARTGKALHVLGLLSPGGVHSHESHVYALLEMAAKAGVKDVLVHAFLDGRDTPPKSAAAYIERLQQKCEALKAGRIATIVGRYYAMDRDRRWERTRAAYDLVTLGKAGFRATTALAALEAGYGRGETDEFLKPTAVGPAGADPAAMQDGDVGIFMNFRADRARQLTRALTDPAFDAFERGQLPELGLFCTLTDYGAEFKLPVAFTPERVVNGFGAYISTLGLKQLRIAETEKYAHVTYFFNGGEEQPYPGEDRILVPSPKVATYDLKPEMSAFEVAQKLEEAIRCRKYDAIICNFANGDMVGHTGNLAAATRAVEVLDACIGRVVTAMQEIGGEVLITADHGNAEMMRDPATHQAHTAHTLNLVPLVYVGRKARIAANGSLQDVAPTALCIMGLPRPQEMTGKPLIDFL